MAVRNSGDTALTFRCAPIEPRHLCGGAGFGDEYQLVEVKPKPLLKPGISRRRYIGTLLLGSMRRLVLSVILRR
jgi:hypothetical protein